MKFEYKLVFGSGYSGMTEDELNALGEEGWELISVAKHGTHDPMRFYFKRQKRLAVKLSPA